MDVVRCAGYKSEAHFKSELIGCSAPFLEASRTAAQVARRRSTVMVLGETGSGKEVLARYMHALSTRAEKPFIPVDCSSLADGLFESELFGHVRGAFTGAVHNTLGFIRSANGGTLFLDEVGELGLHLQAKLLRVLQERRVVAVGDTKAFPVDVRVMAATHRDLPAMVRAGTFRQDLYYRLNVVRIHIPPLRERREDVLPLAKHFLAMQALVYEENAKELSDEAARVLEWHAWPGNVRELANVMEQAHVLASGPRIELADLPDEVRHRLPRCEERPPELQDLRLETVERNAIIEVLRRVDFNKAAASRHLGINIQRLNRRISRLKILTAPQYAVASSSPSN